MDRYAVDSPGVDPRVALVLGVARLGEADLRAWWGSHGLGPAGEWVLSGCFPRTWRCVAMELDLISATRRHDELLPRSTALHLFSDALPFRRLTAAWLGEQKGAAAVPLLDAMAGWDSARALATLAEWSGASGSDQGTRMGRALCLGSVAPHVIEDEARLFKVCQRLVAAYLGQKSDLAPPYFDLAA